MCRTQNLPSVNVNLANNDAPLTPDLLAFSRVNLTKHHQALAKNPPSKANFVHQQPQGNKTSAAKTTGQKSSGTGHNKTWKNKARDKTDDSKKELAALESNPVDQKAGDGVTGG